MAGDIFTAFPLRGFRQDADSRKSRARYQKFAETQLNKYRRVLYVMGNHEAYREDIDETPELIRDFLKRYAPNTRLLNNETEIILLGDEQLAVVGTTLWAPCGVGGPDEWRITNGMRDFSVIRTTAPPPPGMTMFGSSRAFQPVDALALHEKALAFLASEVPKHQRVIVLSHHAPSLHSSAGHLHGAPYLDAAYCSNLVDFILARAQIELWVHGHTHRDVSYDIGGTRVIANHRGYFPDEPMSRRFDPTAVDFDIKEKASVTAGEGSSGETGSIGGGNPPASLAQ
jgi:hypothetical protein